MRYKTKIVRMRMGAKWRCSVIDRSMADVCYGTTGVYTRQVDAVAAAKVIQDELDAKAELRSAPKRKHTGLFKIQYGKGERSERVQKPSA